jgi:rRNA maturation endonuclease Nob1
MGKDRVKDKLELNYSVQRTLDFYANKLFTSKQIQGENVTQWGNRIEKMTTELNRALNRQMITWSVEMQDGGNKTVSLLSKCCFIQGLYDESVKTITRVKAEDKPLKQLIEIALEEESARKSAYNVNQGRAKHVTDVYHPQNVRSVGGTRTSSVQVNRKPGINATAAVTCFRCQKPGHMSRDCKGKPFCNVCGKQGHETRDCKGNQGNRQ